MGKKRNLHQIKRCSSPGRSRPALAAALLAVLVQVFLPLMHASAMAKPAPTIAGETTVVICTAYGYQVVPLSKLIGSDTKDDAAPDKPGKAPRNCALCQAMAHHHVLPPPDAFVLKIMPATTLAAPWIVVGGRILPAAPRLLPPTRAPPLSLA